MGDRRVRRTKRSLHTALIDLAHEKPYGAIAVKEILDRADVSKSTFYTHFQNKDELLESRIFDMIAMSHGRHSSPAVEQVIAFSRPLFEQIDGYRRSYALKSSGEAAMAMHAHLQSVLTDIVADTLATTTPPQIPARLLARHIAVTFVLVLNWWVQNEEPLTVAEVDQRFRALVLPVLTTLRA